MPYIPQDERKNLSFAVTLLLGNLMAIEPEKQDGALNYVITRLLKELYPRKYFHLNRAMGVLSCVMFEFYRRVVAIREEEAMKENGDV